MLYFSYRNEREELWKECSSAGSDALQLSEDTQSAIWDLATIQAVAVLFESLWLFNLDYGKETIFILFIVIWLLAIVSVMLGIFVSTFARHEGHVFPFIPLITLPSAFLTGLFINVNTLPGWAAFIGKCLPLHYAVNIIHEIIKPEYSLSDTYMDFVILIGYIFSLWILASLTLRETE